MAFLTSTAISSADLNGVADIYLSDIQAAQTTLVSYAADGLDAQDASSLVTLSSDGRYLAFSSFANNLVANATHKLAKSRVCLSMLRTTKETMLLQ